MEGVNFKMGSIQTEVQDGLEKEEEVEIGAISRPFEPSLVDISMKPLTIDSIIKRLTHREIDLNTFFQRRAGIWDFTQKSRLIESILIRLPLPAFYFDASNDDKWLVVDGLQRLSVLEDFVVNKKLTLKNLEYLTQFEGFKYDDLPRSMQRRIEEAEIIAYIINPKTPSNVKFSIFKRINTGGVVLTSQEIRNAIYQGKSTQLLKRLSKSNNFLQTTNHSINDERLGAQEIILRFLAFYEIPYKTYKGNLNELLNIQMERLNESDQENLNQLEQYFNTAMERAYILFGDNAFRKQVISSKKKSPINRSLFEVWSVVLAKLSDNHFEQLKKQKKQLNRQFISLLNDTEFEEAITRGTNSPKRVKYRFEKIEQLVREFIDA